MKRVVSQVGGKARAIQRKIQAEKDKQFEEKQREAEKFIAEAVASGRAISTVAKDVKQ